MASINQDSSYSDAFKVSLVSATTETDKVLFRVTPAISEITSASYQGIQPVHLPGGIQVYSFSSSKIYSLTAQLVSRTPREALQNLEYINLMRSWLRNYFGKSDHLGAPPDVLYFNAYSDITSKKLGNINKVPVVLTNLTVNYPNDVDYIPTYNSNIPFPILMSVDLSLTETHAPTEFTNKFDLRKYKLGQLEGF